MALSETGTNGAKKSNFTQGSNNVKTSRQDMTVNTHKYPPPLRIREFFPFKPEMEYFLPDTAATNNFAVYLGKLTSRPFLYSDTEDGCT